VTPATRTINFARDLSGHPVGLTLVEYSSGKPGPRLAITAGVHGDEIAGIEIVRRVATRLAGGLLCGTVLSVPLVNVLSFARETRALPGQEDVNRRFASREGVPSYLSELARVLSDEVLSRCDLVIDLHSARRNTEYHPHLRIDDANPVTVRIAHEFGCAVIVATPAPPGSLRAFAQDNGIPALTYEAGEALRYHAAGIEAGVSGVCNVMASMNMLPRSSHAVEAPRILSRVTWVRTLETGLLRTDCTLGTRIRAGAVLGFVSTITGDTLATIRAPVSGTVVGRATLPLVYSGDRVALIAHDETADETLTGT
jgi:predicted deacylase